MTFSMRRQFLKWSVVFAVVLLPLFANGLTADELRAQITALMQEVARLQQQISSTGAGYGQSQVYGSSQNVYTPLSAGFCPRIASTLRLGIVGPDVSELQTFLQKNGSPEVREHGTFDLATENAVKRWQSSHGIVSSGTAAATGYGAVGPRTRALIALNCSVAPQPTRV